MLDGFPNKGQHVIQKAVVFADGQSQPLSPKQQQCCSIIVLRDCHLHLEQALFTMVSCTVYHCAYAAIRIIGPIACILASRRFYWLIISTIGYTNVAGYKGMEFQLMRQRKGTVCCVVMWLMLRDVQKTSNQLDEQLSNNFDDQHINTLHWWFATLRYIIISGTLCWAWLGDGAT